eukprot:jgi/Psemu1/213831/e_gw1.661.3.1
MRLALLIIAALYCAVDAIPSQTGVDHGLSSARSLLGETNCEDDPDYTWNGKKRFTCAWAGKTKFRKRCFQRDRITGKRVMHHCPRSCKKKCVYERKCLNDNPNYKFNNDSSKNCDWVAEKPTNRCSKKNAEKK